MFYKNLGCPKKVAKKRILHRGKYFFQRFTEKGSILAEYWILMIKEKILVFSVLEYIKRKAQNLY